MTEPLWADLGRRLRDAPEGLGVILFAPSPGAAWLALGQLGRELVDEDLYWHHLGLHGASVARAFAPGRVLFVVGFEALDAAGRADVYAHLNRARDQMAELRTRLVLLVPAEDEELLAENAVDLLAFRGPVRRLPPVEGGPATVEPPFWDIARDVAARRAVACVPRQFPASLLPLLRAIRWGAILFEEGDAPRVEAATDIALAERAGPVPEYVGDDAGLSWRGGRRPVYVGSEVEHAPDEGPKPEAVAAWLVTVRLAAARPEPVGWRWREIVEPGSLQAPEGSRRITIVIGDPKVEPADPILRLYEPATLCEDEAGTRAFLRAEALETFAPDPSLLPALAEAAEVIVVGHGLRVEATLDAAGIPWSYRPRSGAIRIHRPWGDPRTGDGLRADPWPFPTGREPAGIKIAFGRPTAWFEVDGWGPRFAALALRTRPRTLQLAVGRDVPDWLRDAGFDTGESIADLVTWARSLTDRPASHAIDPPLPDLPNDPALAEVIARPRVRLRETVEPLLSLLARERKLWVEGAPQCGKTLFAQLLAFGAATRGDPAWSAWAPPLPDEVRSVHVRSAERPHGYPKPDELWIVDDAHRLRPSELAGVARWFQQLPADAGRVLVLDRTAVDPWGPPRAAWVPPDDPTPWLRWRCEGTPAEALLAATPLPGVLPTWRTIEMAEILRTRFTDGTDPTEPRFVLDAATASFAAAWPLVQPTQLGDVARALRQDPHHLPDVARRHLPGALRRGADGRLDWVRGTDATLARLHALPDAARDVLPPDAVPDRLDVLTRTLAVLEAADAEVLDGDVLAAWLEEARRRPAFAATYLAELLRAFGLDREQLRALLSIRDPALLAAVAEARATAGFEGTWGIGPAHDPRPDEGPARNVRLSPFRIDAAHVTAARYGAFVRAGGYFRDDLWHPEGWAWRTREGIVGPAVPGEPAHPVTGVSWYEADAYARWLGGALPSEAQWEAAASMHGQPGPFSGHVEPVMRGRGFPYDMGGNVLEWCLDGYDPGYPALAPLWDPVCPERSERAARGAPYWVADPADRHRWRRWHLPPTTRREDLGFRVAYRG